MTDTPPDVEARLAALYARRSGSDRVRMACEMFTLARALVVANIRADTPDISAADLRVKIFERTYGDDLVPDDRARVIARLRR
jgi:CMP-2-keto-3-deoxyoctulosonic acid synthetase